MMSTRDTVVFKVIDNRVIYGRDMEAYGLHYYPVDKIIRMYKLGMNGRDKHKLYAFIRERYY